MGRVAEWARRIEAYGSWTANPEKSETQATAKPTEKHLRSVTEEVFPESWVKRLGSQQHPDFLVSTSEVQDRVEAYRRSKRGRKPRSATKDVIEEWESLPGSEGVRFLRLEAKSLEEGDWYTMNDTFPPPYEDRDEVYVLFAGGRAKEVTISTGATMARACALAPPVASRYEESKVAKEVYGSELHRIWSGAPVSTAPRPTFRVKRAYAEQPAPIELLVNLFAAAGLKD